MPGRFTITVLYSVIFGFIIFFALGAHVLIEQVKFEQDGAASVINVAGRQRMLSQRVTLFAGEFVRTGKLEDRDRLLESIYLMQEQHEMLVGTKAGTSFAARLTPDLINLYETQGLNNELQHFVSAAKQVAAGSPADVARPMNILMSLASHSLLEKLDHASSLYQRDSERALEMLHRVENGTVAIMVLGILVEALLIFRPLLRLTNRLHAMAMTDELTELPNRRSFINGCLAHLSRVRGEVSTSALLLVDIDDFKLVNDRHGHDIGDMVLESVARVLSEQARRKDLVGRLGGEEFGVLFTGVTAKQAKEAGNRLIAQVGLAETRISPRLSLRVTISGGITMLEPSDSFESALKRADELLYQAKRNGKARVAAELLPPPSAPGAELARSTCLNSVHSQAVECVRA